VKRKKRVVISFLLLIHRQILVLNKCQIWNSFGGRITCIYLYLKTEKNA